jgi:hypothetical protein
MSNDCNMKTNRISFIKSIIILMSLISCYSVRAQYDGVAQSGEFGIQIGAAHYFGDLNTSSKINAPHPAVGVFFRKQLNNYAAIRIAINHTKLSYSDKLERKNEFQRRRNLDFNSSIWELMLQGDFNFFRFNPFNPDERFTPYLTFGAGVFYYDPYTYYQNEKYYLRSLGTEGQNSPQTNLKEYAPIAVCIPVGFGVKWSLGRKVNMHFEVTHRFTTTDYLDDVSGTYAGAAAFLPDTPSFYLQDRSYETGAPIGIEGSQRGFSANKDQYIIANFGITINFNSYSCPSSN